MIVRPAASRHGPRACFVDAAAARLQRVFHRYPSVRACYDTLCEHVFMHDFRGVEAHDQALWKQLGADVLSHALCFGVCVVQQPRGHVPVVLPWGSYRLAVKLDARRRIEYHVFDIDTYDRELPDAIVLATAQRLMARQAQCTPAPAHDDDGAAARLRSRLPGCAPCRP